MFFFWILFSSRSNLFLFSEKRRYISEFLETRSFLVHTMSFWDRFQWALGRFSKRQMMWGSHPQSPFGWLLNVNIEIYNGQLQSVQKLNSIKTGVFVKLPMGKNKTILLLNHLFVLHHFLHIFYINKPLQVLGKSPFFLGEFTRTAVFPCPGAAAASAAVPEKKGLDAAQATKRLMAIVGRLGVKNGGFSPQNGGWLVVWNMNGLWLSIQLGMS